MGTIAKANFASKVSFCSNSSEFLNFIILLANMWPLTILLSLIVSHNTEKLSIKKEFVYDLIRKTVD